MKNKPWTLTCEECATTNVMQPCEACPNLSAQLISTPAHTHTIQRGERTDTSYSNTNTPYPTNSITREHPLCKNWEKEDNIQ